MSGQRCTSSSTAPSGKRSRKALGSSWAISLTSGSSSDAYGLPEKIVLARVVLPDCRGPVMVITGNPRSKERMVPSAARVIIPEDYIILCKLSKLLSNCINKMLLTGVLSFWFQGLPTFLAIAIYSQFFALCPSLYAFFALDSLLIAFYSLLFYAALFYFFITIFTLTS